MLILRLTSLPCYTDTHEKIIHPQVSKALFQGSSVAISTATLADIAFVPGEFRFDWLYVYRGPSVPISSLGLSNLTPAVSPHTSTG